jgi:diphosphomevalonate decarboxylase
MPTGPSATAVAHPNIAFIKYWGNQDDALRLPANDSLSMTLGGLQTTTSVTLAPDDQSDEATLNGNRLTGPALERISRHLDLIRRRAGRRERAVVISANDFPTGSGVASSASGFAALTVAACAAYGLDLPAAELSRLARRGSGSACRSLFGGFVVWPATGDDATSHGQPLAAADHWPLVDWVVVVDRSAKHVGSTAGHQLATSSSLQPSRVQTCPHRLAVATQAILARDFAQLAEVAELDSDLMHAVMMTSSPPILYWQPASIRVMHQVRGLRRAGTPVFYTLDAGANPHCLCPAESAEDVGRALESVPGVVGLLRAEVGGPARILSTVVDQAG